MNRIISYKKRFLSGDGVSVSYSSKVGFQSNIMICVIIDNIMFGKYSSSVYLLVMYTIYKHHYQWQGWLQRHGWGGRGKL